MITEPVNKSFKLYDDKREYFVETGSWLINSLPANYSSSRATQLLFDTITVNWQDLVNTESFLEDLHRQAH